jgi:hypothetical protein
MAFSYETKFKIVPYYHLVLVHFQIPSVVTKGHHTVGLFKSESKQNQLTLCDCCRFRVFLIKTNLPAFSIQ